MKKSMYSLILSDDIVKAVDRSAAADGTSRSNYVNRILARHLSLPTTEVKIAEIFEESAKISAEEWVSAVKVLPSGNIMEVKSMISVKYNPVIRYSVEVAYEESGYSGEFRVVSRTQSSSLSAGLKMFFEVWAQVERDCMTKLGGASPVFSVADGKYKRTLRLQSQEEQKIGFLIGAYIRVFHQSLELYFSAKNGMDMNTYNNMLALYDEYLQAADVVM